MKKASHIPGRILAWILAAALTAAALPEAALTAYAAETAASAEETLGTVPEEGAGTGVTDENGEDGTGSDVNAQTPESGEEKSEDPAADKDEGAAEPTETPAESGTPTEEVTDDTEAAEEIIEDTETAVEETEAEDEAAVEDLEAAAKKYKVTFMENGVEAALGCSVYDESACVAEDGILYLNGTKNFYFSDGAQGVTQKVEYKAGDGDYRTAEVVTLTTDTGSGETEQLEYYCIPKSDITGDIVINFITRATYTDIPVTIDGEHIKTAVLCTYDSATGEYTEVSKSDDGDDGDDGAYLVDEGKSYVLQLTPYEGYTVRGVTASAGNIVSQCTKDEITLKNEYTFNTFSFGAYDSKPESITISVLALESEDKSTLCTIKYDPDEVSVTVDGDAWARAWDEGDDGYGRTTALYCLTPKKEYSIKFECINGCSFGSHGVQVVTYDGSGKYVSSEVFNENTTESYTYTFTADEGQREINVYTQASYTAGVTENGAALTPEADVYTVSNYYDKPVITLNRAGKTEDITDVVVKNGSTVLYSKGVAISDDGTASLDFTAWGLYEKVLTVDIYDTYGKAVTLKFRTADHPNTKVTLKGTGLTGKNGVYTAAIAAGMKGTYTISCDGSASDLDVKTKITADNAEWLEDNIPYGGKYTASIDDSGSTLTIDPCPRCVGDCIYTVTLFDEKTGDTVGTVVVNVKKPAITGVTPTASITNTKSTYSASYGKYGTQIKEITLQLGAKNVAVPDEKNGRLYYEIHVGDYYYLVEKAGDSQTAVITLSDNGYLSMTDEIEADVRLAQYNGDGNAVTPPFGGSWDESVLEGEYPEYGFYNSYFSKTVTCKKTPYVADSIKIKQIAKTIYQGQKTAIGTVDFGKNTTYTDEFVTVSADNNCEATYEDGTIYLEAKEEIGDGNPPVVYPEAGSVTTCKVSYQASADAQPVMASVSVKTLAGIAAYDMDMSNRTVFVNGKKDMYTNVVISNVTDYCGATISKPKFKYSASDDSVSVDKNGKVTVKKTYDISNRWFDVMALPGDYDRDASDEIMEDSDNYTVTVYVTHDVYELGSAYLAKPDQDDGDDVYRVLTADETAALTVVDDASYVVIVLPKGKEPDENGFVNVEEVVDPGCYTVTSSASKAVHTDADTGVLFIDNICSNAKLTITGKDNSKNKVQLTGISVGYCELDSPQLKFGYDTYDDDYNPETVYVSADDADGDSPYVFGENGTVTAPFTDGDHFTVALYDGDDPCEALTDYKISVSGKVKLVKSYADNTYSINMYGAAATITLKKGKTTVATYDLKSTVYGSTTAAPKLSLPKGQKIYTQYGTKQIVINIDSSTDIPEAAEGVDFICNDAAASALWMYCWTPVLDKVNRTITISPGCSIPDAGAGTYKTAFYFVGSDGKAVSKPTNTLSFKVEKMSKSCRIASNCTLDFTKAAAGGDYRASITPTGSNIDHIELASWNSATVKGKVNAFASIYGASCSDGKTIVFDITDSATADSIKANNVGYITIIVYYKDNTTVTVTQKITVRTKGTFPTD